MQRRSGRTQLNVLLNVAHVNREVAAAGLELNVAAKEGKVEREVADGNPADGDVVKSSPLLGLGRLVVEDDAPLGVGKLLDEIE